jgi:serine protease
MLRKLALGALTAVVLPLGLAQTAQGTPRRHLVPAPETDGVIVKVRGGTVKEPVSDGADSAMPADADVANIERRGSAFSIIRANRALKLKEAQKVAQALEKRPDVLWAEPNARVTIAADPPVTTNDPRFMSGDLTNLWDFREPDDADVVAHLGANNFPVGGYSAKVPSLWRSTRGRSDVVVAVVDTGAVEHPDLTSRIVGGHDFVSRFAGADAGHDGDGWDNDWHDPGDYNNGIFVGCGAATSSWHGSHVAGTVAAADDNAEGVVGVAPGVRILAVRVLGVCGGTIADIAAGISWAAGLPVTSNDPDNPDPPPNPNPADVINMSLGGGGICSNTYQEAINAAVDAGTTVVVAAGNNNSSTISQPGNCNNTITVVSTSEYGSRAAYSNHGAGADVAAPGGDSATNPSRQIWSTVDVGTTTPEGPGYASYQGTSMATPVVSGAVALLYSLGPVTPSEAALAIKDAVAPFPSGVANACTAPDCGTGILDLSRVAAPPDTTKPTATLTSPAPWAQLAPKASVKWTASDGSGTGIKSFTLAHKRAPYNGKFGPTSYVALAAGVTATTAKLAAGSTDCFAIRAIDNADNVGTFSAWRCTSLPLDDRALSRSAGWSLGSSSAYFHSTFTGTSSASRTLAKASAQVKRVGLVATKCAKCGSVAVKVGSTTIGSVNLFSSTTKYKQLISLPTFSLRTGTVSVVTTSSGKPVYIDGLALSRQ